MSVQEVQGNKGPFAYRISGKKERAEGFQESFWQNVQHKEAEQPLSQERGSRPWTASEIADACRVGARGGIRVNPRLLTESMQAVKSRRISYEESDHVKIAVLAGYTLKGAMQADGRAYVEAKYEDGRQEAYLVDVDKVSKNTGHAIEQFALEMAHAGEEPEGLGATDSIGIILRQMDEPTALTPVTKTVFHNGVPVSVTKDAIHGVQITIGGSTNPDWVQVKTSVGTVNIDLNDMGSLMKCLDLFSPEDIDAIMKKITEVKQAREALEEIDRMEDEALAPTEETEYNKGENEEGDALEDAEKNCADQ